MSKHKLGKLSDQDVIAMLERYSCPVPFHTVRTLFLGSIASPSFHISPVQVVQSLWGGQLPAFETTDEVNALFKVSTPAAVSFPTYFLAAYAAVNTITTLAAVGFSFLAAYAAVNFCKRFFQHGLVFLAAYAAVNDGCSTTWFQDFFLAAYAAVNWCFGINAIGLTFLAAYAAVNAIHLR